MELCARVDLEEMISNVDICTLVFLGEMICDVDICARVVLEEMICNVDICARVVLEEMISNGTSRNQFRLGMTFVVKIYQIKKSSLKEIYQEKIIFFCVK